MGISIKEALHIAINALEQQPQTSKNKQAIKLLSNLTSRECFVHWNKSNIISTLNKWIEKHHRIPTVRDLTETGMPKAGTIQKHFNLSASVFLKQQYGHLYPKQEIRNEYGFTCKDDWIECFRTQFIKHDRPKCKQYNLVKDKGTPNFETIVRHAGADNWTDLLAKANVSYQKSNAEPNKVHIRTTTSELLERYEQATKRQEQLTEELINIINKSYEQ